MPDGVVLLSCPNCGSKLEITPEIDRFVCLHCSTQQIVRRSGGIVSIQPLVEGMARIQQGTDKTAAELAIRRLTDEIAKARMVAAQTDMRPLDEIRPPSIIERALPWISGFLLVSSVFRFVNSEFYGLCGFATAGILTLVAYFSIHTVRIRKAKQQQESGKAERYAHVNELETQLAANRRIVSG